MTVDLGEEVKWWIAPRKSGLVVGRDTLELLGWQLSFMGKAIAVRATPEQAFIPSLAPDKDLWFSKVVHDLTLPTAERDGGAIDLFY